MSAKRNAKKRFTAAILMPIVPIFAFSGMVSAGTAQAATAGAAVGTVQGPDAGGWTLNGGAVMSGSTLQLTNATTANQKGSAFWPTALDSSSIDIEFDAAMDSGGGSDGMTLTFADSTKSLPTSVGASGGGLGYAGINGVAVALDTHKQIGGTDPSNNFIGIANGANAANLNLLNWAATTTNIPALRNTPRRIHVVALNGQLTVSVDNTQVLAAPVTLPAKTLVGFTGGNGGSTDRHAVSNVAITKIIPAPPAPPGAPSAPTVTAGNGTATVNWKAPTEVGSAPVSGYVVTSSPGNRTATIASTAATASATVQGLVNGTTYSFSVAAINSAGTGATVQTSAVTPKDAADRKLAKFEPPNGQAYIGVANTIDKVPAFSQAVGIASHPAIFNGYTPVDGTLKPLFDKASTIPGMAPMVSWNVGMTNNSVTNGSKDAYFTAQAAAAKAYGKPVFLRLNWEMNGTWSPNYDVTGGVSPAQYIASWKYIHKFFDSVPNVAWVWSPNGGRYNPDKLSPFAWYPGDTQVDWIALDSYPDYDPNPRYAVTGQDGLNDFAIQASAHNKPLMLAEWARGNSSNPADTADTTNLIFDWAETYPNTVKALVYFDFAGSTYHQIEPYPVTAAAFKARTTGSKYLDTVVIN